MPAMWIGAGASILGGLMGSSSSNKAAKAQQAAAEAARAEQQRQYDTTRGDLRPWRRAGGKAIGELSFMLGLGDASQYNPAVKSAQRAVSDAESEYNALLQSSQAPSAPQGGWQQVYEEGGIHSGDWEFARQPRGVPQGQGAAGGGGNSAELAAARSRLSGARNALDQARQQPYEPGEGYGSLMQDFTLDEFNRDPSYLWRQSEGQKGVENSAAARGGQLSGSNMKDLMRFNQGLASTEYGAAFGRDASQKNRKYNYLTGVSNSGQSAAAQTGTLGTQISGNISDLYTQGGNAQAAGIMGGANALAGGLGGASNAAQNYSLMNALRGGNTQGNVAGPTGYAPPLNLWNQTQY